MSNVVNGYGHAMLKIFNSSNTLLATYNFPNTNEGGTLEDNIPRYKTATNINNTKYSIIKGWHKKWTLHFDNYIKKATLLDIDQWQEYFKSEDYVRNFYPRYENYLYFYDVNFDNADILLGIMKGGVNAIGNKGVILEFSTRYEQTSMGWIDGDITPRYIDRIQLITKEIIKTD